ncbi:MAG: cytochrome c biogenesis protein CcsA [Acidobacteriota bacterium]
MDLALRTAVVLLPLLYVGVAAGYGWMFFADHRVPRKAARPLFHATLTLHLLYLILLTIRWQQFPYATVSQALSATAFAVAVVYAFVEWHGKASSTGFLILSIAALFEVLSSLLRTPNPPYREIFHNPLFSTHAGFGLLGYAAFAVAAGYGFLFLRLYHEIKRRRFSIFFGKLPPLEVLERLMVGALVTGFVALGGSVVSGAVWAEQVFQGAWLSDPKILFTVATWVFYGMALTLRRLRHWHGRQTAIASLLGFAAVLFSMIAVNFFLTDVHGFH